jgi:hypothetical protein
VRSISVYTVRPWARPDDSPDQSGRVSYRVYNTFLEFKAKTTGSLSMEIIKTDSKGTWCFLGHSHHTAFAGELIIDRSTLLALYTELFRGNL